MFDAAVSKAKRSQILVPVPMKQAFIDELADALPRLGYGNRSDFIRDAIIEKLNREGVDLPPVIGAAPSRVGVGGRPSHRVHYNTPPLTPAQFNEGGPKKPNLSQVEQTAAELLKKAIRKRRGGGSGGPGGAKNPPPPGNPPA